MSDKQKQSIDETEQNPIQDFKIEDIKAMNLYERILHAQSEIGWVKKNLNVQVTEKASYKAAGEAGVIDAVKPIEEKYRILSWPIENEQIESGTITDKNGVNKIWMRLRMITRFFNIDNPAEYLDVTTYGDGIDNGDKAPGKATTYAGKYAWLKGYKIQTGDDPDAEGSPDDLAGLNKTTTPPKEKTTPSGNQTPQTAEPITESQMAFMKKLFTEVELAGILDYYHIDALNKITKQNASRMIDKKKAEGNK